MFCRTLFVVLYSFFWPLCCLFFFDIRFLIAPLVSSNSSYIKTLFCRFPKRVQNVYVLSLPQKVKILVLAQLSMHFSGSQRSLPCWSHIVWSLYSFFNMFFFDLRILYTPLVSLNSSWTCFCPRYAWNIFGWTLKINTYIFPEHEIRSKQLSL
jgi:hypothetical protein